ncbi:hypothetical protein [Algoriphagus jejuensis]
MFQPRRRDIVAIVVSMPRYGDGHWYGVQHRKVEKQDNGKSAVGAEAL